MLFTGLCCWGGGVDDVDDVDHLDGMHMCSSLVCVAGVEVLMMLITWKEYTCALHWPVTLK